MHKSGLNINRIMLRDRGPAYDVSINMDVLTTLDNEAVERRHVPEVIRSDELSPDVQIAIQNLFDLLTVRAKKMEGISDG